MTTEDSGFLAAGGILPWHEGDELPEDIIRRYRGDCSNIEAERDAARAEVERLRLQLEQAQAEIERLQAGVMAVEEVDDLYICSCAGRCELRERCPHAKPHERITDYHHVWGPCEYECHESPDAICMLVDGGDND